MTHIDLRPQSAGLALPLQNGDLILRTPELSDAFRMAEYLGDFDVAGNLARVPHPYTLDDARQWLRNAPNGSNKTDFALHHARHGFVGIVGFTHHTNDDATISYWLGKPFWNKGIMTRALITALEWYFTVTKAEQVLSGVFHFNMGSLSIQQKLGFAETGRSLTHCLARGQDVEHIDTELTRDAFELTRDSYSEVAGRNALRT